MNDWAERYETALAELRFDEAAAIAEQHADGASIERVDSARVTAETAARDLHGLITELARENDYRTLLSIARDDDRVKLLQLLPDETSKRSHVHLTGAERWATRQTESNQRRLAEARTALDAVDLDFANALLAKIDDAFMDSAMQDERNELLLAVTARTIEVEEMNARAMSVTNELRPSRRRWWNRRR